jgi:hypothetical protein
MLSRYQMLRGKRPPGNPLPDGVRVDTRKHTRHILRPETRHVEALIVNPSEASFRRFERQYLATLANRFDQDPSPFQALAARAREVDVFLGFSCPTSWNPDVRHCHTTLALHFMKKTYPRLRVQFPALRAAVLRTARTGP